MEILLWFRVLTERSIAVSAPCASLKVTYASCDDSDSLQVKSSVYRIGFFLFRRGEVIKFSPSHFDVLDIAGERKELSNVSVRNIWRYVVDLDRLYLQNVEEHDEQMKNFECINHSIMR